MKKLPHDLSPVLLSLSPVQDLVMSSAPDGAVSGADSLRDRGPQRDRDPTRDDGRRRPARKG
jgi:hypothetical protein